MNFRLLTILRNVFTIRIKNELLKEYTKLIIHLHIPMVKINYYKLFDFTAWNNLRKLVKRCYKIEY